MRSLSVQDAGMATAVKTKMWKIKTIYSWLLNNYIYCACASRYIAVMQAQKREVVSNNEQSEPIQQRRIRIAMILPRAIRLTEYLQLLIS